MRWGPIKDRILTGEPFTTIELAEEFDTRRQTISGIVRLLHKQGHRFNMVQDHKSKPAIYQLVPAPSSSSSPSPSSRPVGNPGNRPNPNQTLSTVIWNRLLTGETLTVQQCVEQIGCSKAMLGYVVAKKQREGHRFRQRVIPGTNALSYTLTSMPTDRTTSTAVDLATPPAIQPVTVTDHPSYHADALSTLNGHYTPMGASWLPRLGEVVQVTLLALDGDGTVRMSLAGGKGNCLLRLESASAG